MRSGEDVPSRTVIISADNGAHARPVAELARLALSHRDPVTLTTAAGIRVDLSSVLAVMDLALNPGDEVVLHTDESAEAEDLLDAMSGVLSPPG